MELGIKIKIIYARWTRLAELIVEDEAGVSFVGLFD